MLNQVMVTIYITPKTSTIFSRIFLSFAPLAVGRQAGLQCLVKSSLTRFREWLEKQLVILVAAHV